MQDLVVKYQSAINNANIKCKIHGIHLTMKLLIAKVRRMYEMRKLG